MLHFIIGRAGFGKTHEIYTILQNQPTGEQTLLLVPEQASFENEKTMLTLPPEKRCEVVSFTRLCHLIFKTYGGVAGTPLTKEEKVLLMAQSVSAVKDRLSVYRKTASHKDFYPHLLAVLGECTFRGVTPAMLQQASLRVPSRGLAGKLAELSLIFSEYQNLVRRQYNDPDHMLEKAKTLLEEEDFWQGKTLLIDGFKDFTHPQKQLLYQMAVHCKEVYLTLCADGLAPRFPFEVFENQKGLVAQITRKVTQMGGKIAPPVILTKNRRAQSPDLELMEGVLAGEDITCREPMEHITICGCTDRYDQANTVASHVAHLVQREGFSYGEIAVITRDLAGSRGVLERAFADFNIPCYTDRSYPFSATPLGIFCKKALTLAQKEWTAEGILALLKTALTPLSPEEIGQLENYAYVWGVEGDAWCLPFTHHPDGGAKTPSESLLQKLNTLRLTAVTPLLQLKEGCETAKTARDFAGCLYQYLVQTESLTGCQTLALALEETDPFTADEIRRAPELLVSLLDRMVRALGDIPLTLSEFSERLHLMMDALTVGTIPKGMDQVLIGDALHTRPANPKGVILMDANNGVFPGVPSSGGLLSDRDREMLIQLDIPLSDRGREDTVEESFLFYTAACQGSKEVLFTYLTEDNGMMCTPLATLLTALPGCNHIQSHQRSPLLQTTALAPALALLSQRFYQNTPLTGSLYTYFEEEHPALTQKLNRQIAPVPCGLTPETAKGVFGENITLSPSKVEVYHKCAYSYLLRYGLKLEEKRRVAIDPLSRGNVVHYVLEHMIKRHGKALSLQGAKELEQQVHALVLEYVEKEMGGTDQKTPHFLFQLTTLQGLLTTLLSHMGAEMDNSLFAPAACELEIGWDKDVPPLCLPLRQGGKLYLMGKVDRVDTYEKEGITYFRVVDYKTGHKDFVLDDIHYGIGLQMLLYLFLLEKNGTFLGQSRVPGGILYMPATFSGVKATEKDPSAAVAAALKMKGLILDHPTVLEGMDPNKLGLYLPLSFKKDGEPTAKSALASLEYLGKTRKRLEGLLTQMGNRLQQGNITCDPLDPASSGADACGYCSYGAVCPLGGEGVHRKVKKLTDAEKKALLKGDEIYGI